MSPQGPHFSPHSTAKITHKSQWSRVHFEKTRLKKLIDYDNFYYEFIARNGGRQKLTSAMKLRPEK